MLRGDILVGILLVLWTITAPVPVSDATATSVHSEPPLGSVDKVQQATETPTQSEGNETIFREVETDNSSFVIEANLSLFTTLFEPGSVLRIVTGGTAYGERVVWFDIGIARSQDGFETRADMMINLPYL
ncbi:hypothetical protein [Natronomonas moolapensis]|uniref:hypothetical protein n=1 Tax=Natronomonas moolapensis TaxID=416273 RepID=UPI000677DFF1|nr:hypothetical protein [Natronomonas moolapensis]